MSRCSRPEARRRGRRCRRRGRGVGAAPRQRVEQDLDAAEAAPAAGDGAGHRCEGDEGEVLVRDGRGGDVQTADDGPAGTGDVARGTSMVTE